MAKKTKDAKKKGKKGKKGKSNYVNLGILCLSQDGDNFYIKVNPEVELTVNGQTFEGEYINLQSPEDKFEFLLENGHIDEDEYNKKIEAYGEGGDLENIRQFVSLRL